LPNLQRVIDKGLVSETNFNSDLVIDIEEENILNINLKMDDEEAYSWYRVQPNAFLWGNNSQMTWAFFPAFYFEEYAKIWGSRPLNVVSNYLNYNAYEGESGKINQDSVIRQAFYDNMFLIESNAYLPFTRKGSITLNNGDRRLRKGICCRLKSTNEIFYIKEVSHEYSINTASIERTTSINVERGMKEPFIRGVKIPGIEETVSYFNIIKTDIKENFKQIEGKIAPETINDVRLNKDVFDFFIKRRQFI